MTDQVVYLSAMEEGRYTIAQANSAIDKKQQVCPIELDQLPTGNDYLMALPEDIIDYMDVSPKQLVSRSPRR